MPLLVINVHLISDVSYPGSFTITGFSYAFVCIIKWSSPAAIIPLTEVLSAISKSPLHLQRATRAFQDAQSGSGTSQHLGLQVSLPAHLVPGLFPAHRPPSLRQQTEHCHAPAAAVASWGKGACVRPCVCPWDLLVKCFPFPGDIFDIKIKGQRGKQTYFPPSLSLEFGIVKQAALVEILFESSWLS